MAFNPKRYSRLCAAQRRAYERWQAAPPAAGPKALRKYEVASDLLARYVERHPGGKLVTIA